MRKAWNFHIGQMKICHSWVIPFDEHLGRQTVTIMVMWFFGTKGTSSLSFISYPGSPFQSFYSLTLGLAQVRQRFPLQRLFSSRVCCSQQSLFFEELWLKIEAVSSSSSGLWGSWSPPQGHTWGISSCQPPIPCSHYISYLSQVASLVWLGRSLTNLGKDI